MGPVNWLAVLVAAVLAVAISALFRGAQYRASSAPVGDPSRGPAKAWVVALILLLAAIMLGHNFARLGKAVLDAKPWLYFMQTGGVALFFVIPAVWLTHARAGSGGARRMLDCGFWLVAYLAMGLVFWIMG